MNVEVIDYFKNQISYFSTSPRSYFDSSSFTLISNLVLEAVDAYYKSGGSRPSTGLYPGTSLASVTIETCRSTLRDFFSVSDGEIVFPVTRGAGIVQLLYSLSQTGPIILFPYTGLDHDIWLPVFELAEQLSLSSIPIPVKTSFLEIQNFLISETPQHSSDTKVIILPYTSLGTGLTVSLSFLSNIKSIPNTYIILDCTFAVGVSQINLSKLPIDAAVFDSNIGLGGPIGSGIMYLHKSLLNKMNPYVILGNGTIIQVTTSSFILDNAPQSLEGSINPAILAGITKSIDILNQISLATIRTHILSLKDFFFEQLKKTNDIALLGSLDSQDYANIIGFIIPNVNMHEIAMYLDEVHNIDIRSGSFCAHPLIDQLYARLNLQNSNLGILQLSFHYYSTKQDIEKLISAIREFLNIFK